MSVIFIQLVLTRAKITSIFEGAIIYFQVTISSPDSIAPQQSQATFIS
tara:strand:- start:236 stop:379 length:144 start_codon:yes stop_codon:yes gene_type:complete